MAHSHDPREEYGKTLLQLARENRNIIALDADLCKSTMTYLIEKELPSQYIEMGIAEQNMLSTAAGLSLVGKIPFVNSFAVFITGRAFDQIRQAISIAELNVKIIGSSAGLSDFGDGATHQTVEDISIMRSIPNMTVLVPCDAIQTGKVIREIVKQNGPVYVRISRTKMEDLTSEDDEFKIGKAYTLKEGKDITLFATGIMVEKALKAAGLLEKEGISVKVVNVCTIKPLDREAVIKLSRDTGAVVTAEEHSIIGGLGSAIVEALRNETHIPVEFVGINDCFGQSSNNYEELVNLYNLTQDNIIQTIKKVLKLKTKS
jgi:transketolase